MRTALFCLAMLAITTFLINCTEPQNEPVEDDVAPAPDDRNMFGHYIPRGLTKTSENLAPGYVMFAVPNSSSFYLIDRSGQVVHEWKGKNREPVYGEVGGAYLLNDGSIIQNSYDMDFPVFAGGGEAGRLQNISWDGKILWDFEYANEKYHHHHDMAVMPNGNILAIAWEAKAYDECVQAGRDPEQTPKAGLWPDKIVEIRPDGINGGEIVWEWHFWDHLIQDFDQTRDNYGDPAAHPELLDINKGASLPPPISQDSMDVLHAQGRVWRNETIDNRGSDFYHSNAINYNQELDQIAISAYHLNEILIIDHSTTTEEAAGHRGGRWGKGGDFLYRWGNPQNYHRGDSLDQRFFHQHDVRWIERGKPGVDNLTVFNNNIPLNDSVNYSSVVELVLPVDDEGHYVIEDDAPFGPPEPVWQYIAEDTLSFWASFISGAHRTENGNTLITEGPRGRFFEVNPEGEIVWEYLNQHRGEIRKLNGDLVEVMPFTYWGFRSTFIPADHPGLAGRDLKPLDPQPPVFKLPAKEEQ